MVEVASNGEVDPDEKGEGNEAHDDAVDGEHVEGVVAVPTEFCCFWIRRPEQQLVEKLVWVSTVQLLRLDEWCWRWWWRYG